MDVPKDLSLGDGGFRSWNIEQAKFQGYVAARLEDISADLKEMKTKHESCRKEMFKRTTCNSKAINKIRMTAVGIAGLGGLLGSFLKGLIWR